MSKKEPAPSPQGRPATRMSATDAREYIGHDHHDGLGAEDWLDAQVIAEAKTRGFRLAIRCRRCNQWLVASQSVAVHLGPVCRAKVTAA
jgi:Family of unknown function (DUF6011)